MALHHFDNKNQQIGVTKTTEEVESESIAIGVLGLFISVTWPIFWAGWKTGIYVKTEWRFHDLFAIIVGIATISALLYLLVKSRPVRLLYFLANIIVYSFLVFQKVSASSDLIWASAAAIVTLAVTTLLGLWLDGEISEEFK